MTKFFPYFEANGIRHTILNGMRIFLNQENQAIAIQSPNSDKVSHDPKLVKFWQKEIEKKYA